MKSLHSIACSLLVIFGLSGCSILDKKIQDVLQTTSEKSGVRLAAEDINISVLGGSGQISRLVVGNPQGYIADNAFEMQLVRLDLKLSSLLFKPITLNELIIDSPVLNIELNNPEGSNIKDITNKFQAAFPTKELNSTDTENSQEPESEPSKGQPIHIAIRDLKIEGVTFTLRQKDGAIHSGTLPSITLKNIGGENGATTAKIASIITMVITGKVLAKFAINRIVDRLLESERIARRIEQVLMPQSGGPVSTNLHGAVQDYVIEIISILERVDEDGFASLDSFNKEMSAAANKLLNRIDVELENGLTEKQRTELKLMLDDLITQSIDSLRETLVDRIQQRLLLKQDQIQQSKAIIESIVKQLYQLTQRIKSGELDRISWQAEYHTLTENNLGRLHSILDENQLESLNLWMSRIDQLVTEKAFTN